MIFNVPSNQQRLIYSYKKYMRRYQTKEKRLVKTIHKKML